MEASTLNTNQTIFLIPRCSSRPLNYTFLSIHPFLCGHTKKMASLVSNGMETEIKDWSVMKAENPTPPIPIEKLPTPTILSTLSTKASQNFQSRKCAPIKCQKQNHDPFFSASHKRLGRCEETSTVTWGTYTPNSLFFPTHCTLTAQNHPNLQNVFLLEK